MSFAPGALPVILLLLGFPIFIVRLASVSVALVFTVGDDSFIVNCCAPAAPTKQTMATAAIKRLNQLLILIFPGVGLT